MGCSRSYTIKVERFTGLNICGFGPMKFSQESFRGPLACSVYYLTIAIKVFMWGNFCCNLKTAKTVKV